MKMSQIYFENNNFSKTHFECDTLDSIFYLKDEVFIDPLMQFNTVSINISKFSDNIFLCHHTTS